MARKAGVGLKTSLREATGDDQNDDRRPIGLVNELKIVCDRMGIDIHEVIRAAATKPFGFTPYYPGPGLGGHCIGVDPFYLTHKAIAIGYHPEVILAGRRIKTAWAPTSRRPWSSSCCKAALASATAGS